MRKRLVTLGYFLFFFWAIHAQEDVCSCCTENHKAFDFWIGTWEVSNSDGTPAGKNIIKKIQDNCALQEQWISAKSDYTGTSYNFYNTTTELWEQLWIDNSGTHLKLKGVRKGNQMILSSDESVAKDGFLYQNRITWTLNKDGSVRQLWVVLKNGEVTSVAFDGLYRKKE